MAAPKRALRAFGFALMLLVAVPGAAGAATVSVEPYVEPPPPPGDDGMGSCGRFMMCPADMLVFTAATGEQNDLTVTQEISPPPQHRRFRFRVRDGGALVQAGTGCEQIDPQTAVCTAEILGPVQLGDGNDRIVTDWSGDVSGGDGDDVLLVPIGDADGDEGDDVVIGDHGLGGGGNDVLMVRSSGLGDSGDDMLRCFPQEGGCYLRGGSGNDLLTGGTGGDRLFGDRGRDLVEGRAGDDRLAGGLGDDRLIGGPDRDQLAGDSGADRLVSREDRSAGEARALDGVDCGVGRRDRAVTDRRDDVKRCERETPRRGGAR